jgi:hypothetical protein
MTPRRFIVLLVVALAVIGAAVWLSSQRTLNRAISVGATVFPELKSSINTVTELRLKKQYGPSVTLKKGKNDWFVAERGYIADEGRVRKLLLDIVAIQVNEEKTSDPKLYAALGLDEKEATRLEIVSPKETWSVLIGKSMGGKSSFIRLPDAKQSLEVNRRLEAQTDPERWLDRDLLNIEDKQIKRVEIQPARGPAYTVERANAEQQNFTVAPLPAKRKLAYDGAANVLADGLESLTLDDVRSASATPSTDEKVVESSKVTYHTFDNLRVMIAGRKVSTPGATPQDPRIENYYITLSSTDERYNERFKNNEFKVAGYKYETMVKPLDDLLAALEK